MQVEEISWFHSIDLPDGSITKGLKPNDVLKREAEGVFRYPVTGKSVLDVGSWDGFFSFEAERRGAGSVLSTDWFCWGGPGWGTKAGYDFAHQAFNSKAESKEVDVFSLDPAAEGQHDVVLFLGVLYHLKNPLEGLERVAAMARECLVVETECVLDCIPYPLLRYYPSRGLNNDPTNFFVPNRAWLVAALKEIGFARVDVAVSPVHRSSIRSLARPFVRTRQIAHAWRA